MVGGISNKNCDLRILSIYTGIKRGHKQVMGWNVFLNWKMVVFPVYVYHRYGIFDGIQHVGYDWHIPQDHGWGKIKH